MPGSVVAQGLVHSRHSIKTCCNGGSSLFFGNNLEGCTEKCEGTQACIPVQAKVLIIVRFEKKKKKDLNQSVPWSLWAFL